MYTRSKHVKKHVPEFKMPAEKTRGERWHEEVMREDPILSGLVLALGFLAILTLVVVLGSQQAYGNQLAAGTELKVQATDKVISKESYVGHIAKLRSIYSGELLRNEKKVLVQLVIKAADGGMSTAKKASKRADKLVMRPKAVKKRKARLVASLSSEYRELKSHLDSRQRSSVISSVKGIKAARTDTQLNRYEGAAQAVFQIGQLRVAYAADGWPEAKLMYVSEWAPRIDNYLAGTPMAGTGAIISRISWDHDMDARLYPAIAMIESGCGVAPYGCAFNVCGWVWNPPAMYSWEDACLKWHSYFSQWFGGERYPITSMHGYGGYGPSYVNDQMARI